MSTNVEKLVEKLREDADYPISKKASPESRALLEAVKTETRNCIKELEQALAADREGRQEPTLTYTLDQLNLMLDTRGRDEYQRGWREALAARPILEGKQNERGWLIEIEGPKWLCHDGLGGWDWTQDSVAATRFARRQDADGVAAIFDDLPVSITEHIWSDPLAAASRVAEPPIEFKEWYEKFAHWDSTEEALEAFEAARGRVAEGPGVRELADEVNQCLQIIITNVGNWPVGIDEPQEAAECQTNIENAVERAKKATWSALRAAQGEAK